MSSRPRGRLWRASAFAVALYSVFLITVPFEHHDLACHLKTPSHCTSCASSLVGSNPHAPAVLDGSDRADAGRTSVPTAVPYFILLPADSQGRSPPSA